MANGSNRGEHRSEDRRFYSTLFLVFGPPFQMGGWFVAFTGVGAVLVVAGATMCIIGFLLRPMTVTFVAMLAGLLLGGVWILALPVVT